MTTNSDSAISALDVAQNAFDNAAKSSEHWVQPWTPELVKFLAVGVLAFSFFAFILATILLWRSGAQGHQILRVFGILSIVSFSTLLLVVGYSNEQLTPIVGLFGAIAGYLLGKDSSLNKDK